VRKLAAMLALSLLGCSHLSRSHAESSADAFVIDATSAGDLTRYDPAVSPIDELWVAGVAGVESATSATDAAYLCGDDDADPPHLCPGTAPASPSATPPPD